MMGRDRARARAKNVTTQKPSLTHISLASFLWDIGKQWRTRSDATDRGV